jgi:hypothetical protein
VRLLFVRWQGLLLCGGFDGGETNDVLRYDLESSSWEVLPSSWLRPRSVCASFGFAHPSGGALLVFGGEVAPSALGHEGAGGFGSDLIAIDAATGTPLPLNVDQPDDGPPARGWAAATAVSPTTGVLFGGLSGSDAAPKRLDDAWVLTLDEPMAYHRTA